MFQALIAFSSNYEAESHLIKGLKALKEKVEILDISPVYENSAIAEQTTENSVNGIVLITTNLSAIELQKEILEPIENNLGRIRGKAGQIKCSIDLNLLLYEQEIISTPELKIPAADILCRAFVAVPLGIIAPNWIHPETKETMAEIGNKFAQEQVKILPRIDINIIIAKEILTEKTLTPLKPWYWRSIPLANRTGSEIFEALFLNKPSSIATLLESPSITNNNENNNENNKKLARYSICAGSPRIINNQPQMWMPSLGNILPFLRSLLQRQQLNTTTNIANNIISTTPPEIPFTGGYLGWLGYDLAWEIERLPQQQADILPFPVAYWYEPECFAVADHYQQILWLAGTTPAQLEIMENQIESYEKNHQNHLEELAESLSLAEKHSPINPILEMSQNEYENAVKQAQKYIHAGDIFQANLSLRFQTSTPVDSWSIYRSLQYINPSPFASYWQTPWGVIISCSPERLIQLSGKQVQTRPIAGTRSRGITPQIDENLAQELITNIKERAEHIMLVDLERNDIGRVCQWGTVKVNEFLTIERYSHVMHLVSNIIGILSPECDSIDLIRGVFPGGTITGCPKVRCMEIIEELEPIKRNLFYGSCGYLDWRGDLDLNILIRTLLYTKHPDIPETAIVWGQVGAGIVADSDPEKEWIESLHKAQAQLNALNLAEIFHGNHVIYPVK